MRVPRVLTSENFTTARLCDPHPFCRTLTDWIDCFFEGTPYHSAMGRESRIELEQFVGHPIFLAEDEDLDELAGQHCLTKRDLWEVWNRALDRAYDSQAAGDL